MAIITAPASDVEKDFGSYHDRALTGEAVRVTEQGRETVFIVLAETFHELKQGQRRAITTSDLSEEELRLIEAAEIPTQHRYRLADEAGASS